MVHADHVNSWWGVELLIPLLKHTKYYYFLCKIHVSTNANMGEVVNLKEEYSFLYVQRNCLLSSRQKALWLFRILCLSTTFSPQITLCDIIGRQFSRLFTTLKRRISYICMLLPKALEFCLANHQPIASKCLEAKKLAEMLL